MTDIMIDRYGNLVTDAKGDAALISDIDCLIQDLKLEACTQEGECFWDTDRGWSLLDFLHCEYDDLLETKITQRIKSKLSAHADINQKSILISTNLNDEEYRVKIEFKIVNSSVSYLIDLAIKESEVSVND